MNPKPPVTTKIGPFQFVVGGIQHGNILLNGAGESGINNQPLITQGNFNGKPEYFSGTGSRSGNVYSGFGVSVYWSGTDWRIGSLDSPLIQDLYRSTETVDYPIQVSHWVSIGGTNPPPTISTI